MNADLIKRLWESDAASALTNEAARRIERDAAALTEAQATIARLEGALRPFCFFDEDGGDTQSAWEIRYRDRFQDWVDFADIEAARAALSPREGEGT